MRMLRHLVLRPDLTSLRSGTPHIQTYMLYKYLITESAKSAFYDCFRGSQTSWKEVALTLSFFWLYKQPSTIKFTSRQFVHWRRNSISSNFFQITGLSHMWQAFFGFWPKLLYLFKKTFWGLISGYNFFRNQSLASTHSDSRSPSLILSKYLK